MLYLTKHQHLRAMLLDAKHLRAMLLDAKHLRAILLDTKHLRAMLLYTKHLRTMSKYPTLSGVTSCCHVIPPQKKISPAHLVLGLPLARLFAP